MAVLILLLCLSLCATTTTAASTGGVLSRETRNVRLSVSDITAQSAVLEWSVPDDEVTQKGFKITCTGSPLTAEEDSSLTTDQEDVSLPREQEDYPDTDPETDAKDETTLYAFEDTESVIVTLKPGHKYSCALMVGGKGERAQPWRELIQPISFETLDLETASTTTEANLEQAAPMLSFSKNYREALALIVFGGVVPIFLMLGCLGACILYYKCRVSRDRQRDQRYAAFAHSLKKSKKMSEIAELGLGPGLTNMRNAPWENAQNLFQTHAQPPARSGRYSRPFFNQRNNTPVTSIRLAPSNSDSSTGSGNSLGSQQSESSSSSNSHNSPRRESSGEAVTSVYNIEIPPHIRTDLPSSTGMTMARTHRESATTGTSHALQGTDRPPRRRRVRSNKPRRLTADGPHPRPLGDAPRRQRMIREGRSTPKLKPLPCRRRCSLNKFASKAPLAVMTLSENPPALPLTLAATLTPAAPTLSPLVSATSPPAQSAVESPAVSTLMALMGHDD